MKALSVCLEVNEVQPRGGTESLIMREGLTGVYTCRVLPANLRWICHNITSLCNNQILWSRLCNSDTKLVQHGRHRGGSVENVSSSSEGYRLRSRDFTLRGQSVFEYVRILLLKTREGIRATGDGCRFSWRMIILSAIVSSGRQGKKVRVAEGSSERFPTRDQSVRIWLRSFCALPH